MNLRDIHLEWKMARAAKDYKTADELRSKLEYWGCEAPDYTPGTVHSIEVAHPEGKPLTLIVDGEVRTGVDGVMVFHVHRNRMLTSLPNIEHRPDPKSPWWKFWA